MITNLEMNFINRVSENQGKLSLIYQSSYLKYYLIKDTFIALVKFSEFILKK